MQLVVVGIVAEFDVEIAEVVEQEDVFPFVAIRQNVAGKVEGIELLVGGEFREIGGLHKQTGVDRRSKQKAGGSPNEPPDFIYHNKNSTIVQLKYSAD